MIDISHDGPVYDPKALEHRGLVYHKFPAFSTIPPITEEVRGFVDRVKCLRSEMCRKLSAKLESRHFLTIAVHCHGGIDRTGFLRMGPAAG